MGSRSSRSLVKKFVGVSVGLIFLTDVAVGSNGNMAVFKDLAGRCGNFSQFRQIVEFVRTFRTVVRNLKVSIFSSADYPFGTQV